MATRWEILQQELDTDPLGRNYGAMDDAAAASDLNLMYRDGAADGNLLVQYTLTEAYRTNTGADLEQLTIYARLYQLSRSSEGDDVYGSLPTRPATRTDVAAAVTIMRLLDTDVQTLITNINDVRYAQLLDALAAAGAMAQSDADEMKSFSQNKRTRGQELEVGSVSEGDVAYARSLP